MIVSNQNTAIPGSTEVKDIVRTLDKIPAASLDYESWVKAAMAVHSELPDDVGLALFDNWSQSDAEMHVPPFGVQSNLDP
jgi:hypothetical protein